MIMRVVTCPILTMLYTSKVFTPTNSSLPFTSSSSFSSRNDETCLVPSFWCPFLPCRTQKLKITFQRQNSFRELFTTPSETHGTLGLQSFYSFLSPSTTGNTSFSFHSIPMCRLWDVSRQHLQEPWLSDCGTAPVPTLSPHGCIRGVPAPSSNHSADCTSHDGSQCDL